MVHMSQPGEGDDIDRAQQPIDENSRFEIDNLPCYIVICITCHLEHSELCTFNAMQSIQLRLYFRIREVWSHNLEEEFKQICLIVNDYPYVAMDTEFPGVVARPIGDFKSSSDYQYQLLRCNVDLLKIIQLGLTFFNKEGEMPQVRRWILLQSILYPRVFCEKSNMFI